METGGRYRLGMTVTVRIDFEGLDTGEFITELSPGNGISGCSGNKKVTVESQNTIFSNNAASDSSRLARPRSYWSRSTLTISGGGGSPLPITRSINSVISATMNGYSKH